MEVEEINKYFNFVVEDFRKLIKKPECFLEGDNSLSEIIKINVKQNYDVSKCEERKFIKSGTLPELIIKDFDLEQIWQQIELQNNVLLANCLTNVSKLITVKNSLIFSNLKSEISRMENDKEGDRNFSEISEENESDDLQSNHSSNLDLSDEDLGKGDIETKMSKSHEKKSVVDDDFFKLSEMEEFLNKEEKKMENTDSGNDTEESASEAENSINLFESNSDDEGDKIKTAKFKDFFVAKEDNRKPKGRKSLEVVSDENNDDQMKSSLELRQERLNRRIKKIEQDNISEKPWQLRGEITAENRPQNSLLEEILEFDLTSRPAPIITEQTTLQLEDIIKQRIKDRVFDSVTRKIKPVETPLEYKKKLVLDQEKSKHSLAQIYEQEFLEQQAILDPESIDKEEVEPESHKEIKTLMKDLFNKLDALSNFHFTPKPAIPELRVVNNLPAVTMEEVAPVAASESALLAPEEVKNKVKGEIIGKTERTATDKNRERRKKKLKQREHVKEKKKREHVNNNINSLSNKYSKKNLFKQQPVTNNKNTDKMTGAVGQKAIKSSKAFFTQLQEDVQTHISGKMQQKRPNKTKQQMHAKKIKL